MLKPADCLLGGPFDLMSRRMICANDATIAQRIIKEIEIFEVTRDDKPAEESEVMQKCQ